MLAPTGSHSLHAQWDGMDKTDGWDRVVLPSYLIQLYYLINTTTSVQLNLIVERIIFEQQFILIISYFNPLTIV